MATASDARSIHATLGAAVADTVTITGPYDIVDVENKGTVGLYITQGNTAVPPAAATVAGAGTLYVAPGTVKRLLAESGQDTVISLISSGAPAYGVEGQVAE